MPRTIKTTTIRLLCHQATTTASHHRRCSHHRHHHHDLRTSQSKFGWAPHETDKRRQLVEDYVAGLYWVLEYYHNGVGSWDWYSPYQPSTSFPPRPLRITPRPSHSNHLRQIFTRRYYPHLYAPLVSDLVNLATVNTTFTDGAPFTPLMQLLSVLPAQVTTVLNFNRADIAKR